MFGARDAVERTLVRAGSTCANFDDHDDVVLLHEQIDLGATDVQVAVEDRISYVLKVVCRGLFRAGARCVTGIGGLGRGWGTSSRAFDGRVCRSNGAWRRRFVRLEQGRGVCRRVGSLSEADAFALRGVEVALDGAARAFRRELGVLLDAVLARELFVAEADVGSDLRAGVAVRAFAEVEVGIRWFTVGHVAAARAVDGLFGVAFRRVGALAADLGVDHFVGAGDAARFVFISFG